MTDRQRRIPSVLKRKSLLSPQSCTSLNDISFAVFRAAGHCSLASTVVLCTVPAYLSGCCCLRVSLPVASTAHFECFQKAARCGLLPLIWGGNGLCLSLKGPGLQPRPCMHAYAVCARELLAHPFVGQAI